MIDLNGSKLELWTEKYRPQTLDQYVWRDRGFRAQIEEWLAIGQVPNLLFCGVQGTGKTSLALLILRILGIQRGDILELNASLERNVGTVEDKIIKFVSTWALGDYNCKYVLLDEADVMSPLAQRVLKRELEHYHSTARFILTCNRPDKIITELHSRLIEFSFPALDRDEFTRRIAEILSAEEVEFENETVIGFIDQAYPDLRKCINLMQQNCRSGRLEKPVVTETVAKDYMLEMAGLFKAGRYLEARKLIVTQAQHDEYDDIFRFLYRNLDLWGDTQNKQDQALLIIRTGLVNHSLIADPEINLSATLAELCMLND